MRKCILGCLAVLLLLPAAATAQQPEHPWLIRGRGIAIIPDASSTPAGLDVESDATIEIDISYFIHRQFAFELVLASAAQEVLGPNGSLGAVNHLPPTLLFQFHPVTRGTVRPYIGGGGNATFFYNKSGPLVDFDLSTSLGLAGQVGFDFILTSRAVFNLDAKYISISTDVDQGGTTAFNLDINPLVIGAGFGYRF